MSRSCYRISIGFMKGHHTCCFHVNVLGQGYDMIEDMYNPKSAANQVASSWITARPKGNIEFFMLFIVQNMMEYQVAAC